MLIFIIKVRHDFQNIENVLISVKYSKDKYPNAPVEKFKDTLQVTLGMAIESFKKSELRAKTY
jgi:hypothetical protein